MKKIDFTADVNTWLEFSRYPGQYGGPEDLYDRSDAQAAVESAQAVIGFVEKNIRS